MQTIRLQRAKALVVFSNVANSVLDDSVLDDEALKAEITREPDATIKDLLQQVLKSID
jgi:energy-coupling factor transporter ATP-binding protein EcfA2